LPNSAFILARPGKLLPQFKATNERIPHPQPVDAVF